MCLLKRFWYKLYQFGGFHLTFQSEDDGPSAQRPTAVSEDQSCKAVLERLTMSGDHRSRITRLESELVSEKLKGLPYGIHLVK